MGIPWRSVVTKGYQPCADGLSLTLTSLDCDRIVGRDVIKVNLDDASHEVRAARVVVIQALGAGGQSVSHPLRVKSPQLCLRVARAPSPPQLCLC